MTRRISHVVRVAMTSALLVLVIGVPASEAGKRHPKCFGRVATIVTDKPTITGTSHTDVIVATGTRGDTIRAMGGNDYVCSGLGNDIVDGGKGDDKIDGGPGDDGGRRRLAP